MYHREKLTFNICLLAKVSVRIAIVDPRKLQLGKRRRRITVSLRQTGQYALDAVTSVEPVIPRIIAAD
jgi:hypothetical protein